MEQKSQVSATFCSTYIYQFSYLNYYKEQQISLVKFLWYFSETEIIPSWIAGRTHINRETFFDVSNWFVRLISMVFFFVKITKVYERSTNQIVTALINHQWFDFKRALKKNPKLALGFELPDFYIKWFERIEDGFLPVLYSSSYSLTRY